MRGLISWWRTRQLASDDPRVRLAAVERLGRRRSAAAVSIVCPMLADREQAIRLAAAAALGKIADPAATQPLVQALAKERHWDVRAEMLEALRQIGDPSIISDLVALLEKHQGDVALQQIVTQALKEFGGQQLTAAQRAVVAICSENWTEALALGAASVPLLAVRARSATSRIRRQAAAVLGQIGDDAAVRALVELLDDRDRDVRLAAAAAIHEHSAKRVDARHVVRAAALLDNWSNLPGLGVPAVAPLAELVRTGDPQTRSRAVRVLGQIHVDEALGPLLDAVQNQDVSLRRAAIEALAGFPAEAACAELVRVMHEEDGELSTAAAKALRARGWKPALAVDEAALLVTAGEYMEAARKGPPAIKCLLRALRQSKNRARVLEALETVGPAVNDALLELLTDPAEALRICAAEVLAETGGPSCHSKLRAALADSELSVRRAALAALQQLGWRATGERERAEVAVAVEDWDQLGEIGPGALPVLAPLVGDEQRADPILRAVEAILRGPSAGTLDAESLTRLASLNTTPTRAGGLQGRNPDGGKSLQAAVARRRVSQLARAELQRRGVAV